MTPAYPCTSSMHPDASRAMNALRQTPLIFLFAGALAGGADLHAQQNEQAVSAATEAARSWLEVLDADEFRKTWEMASPTFKKQVSGEQWADKVRQAHASLGIDSLRSRTVEDARYRSSVPNAPEGEYVIAQFRATYDQQETTETVTLRREEDGWRVVGYYIKPAP